MRKLSWVPKALALFLFVFFVGALSQAHAASILTINDGTDVWTLNIQTSCSSCAVTLQVKYGAASARAGLFLDSVQWEINTPNVTPTVIGFNATTAGAVGSWTFNLNSLNANQCTGGNSSAVCGAYTAGGAAGGFGPIVAGSTLTWGFQSTFASALPAALTAGNIRAAYNNADGSNAGIFSPNGGNFTQVPEPSSLLLLGSGLMGLGLWSRRFKKN